MSALSRLTAPLALGLALAHAPAFGQDALHCEGDTCTLTVHDLLAFRGPSDVFATTSDGGFVVNGDLTLVTPYAEFPLPEAYLSVVPTEIDGPLDFEVIGTVRPDLTSLPGVGQHFTSGPTATFGVATREVLQGLLGGELPLPENVSPDDPTKLLEPAYVFFHFDTGVELDLPLADVLGLDPEALASEFGYSLPEAAATLVIDPTDPFFYFAMDDMLAEDGGDEEDDSENSDEEDDGLKYQLDAVAFSWLGGIPFEPATSWGLPEGCGEFKGNVLVGGAVTIYGFEIDGEIVAGATPEGVGLGANADVSFGFAAGDYGVTIPLGEATVAMNVAPYEVDVAVSGLVDLESIELDAGGGVLGQLIPDEIPLSIGGQLMAAAYLHTNGLGYVEAGLAAEGEFRMAPYGLETWALTVGGALTLDSEGIWISGMLLGELHPALDFQGEVSVEASFLYDDPASWYIGASGKLIVAGTNLGDANVLINGEGIFIDAAYTTHFSTIELVGELTANGPYLTGTTSVNLGQEGIGAPIVAAQEAVANAQAGLASIDEEMAALVAFIEAERAAFQQGIDVAQSVVDAAQDVVASLQGSIAYHYGMIATYQSQISWWYNWAYAQPWYNQAWAWTVYAGEVGWRNVEIAGHNASITTLSAAQLVATAALDVAEAGLGAAEQLLDTFPIEQDPRVVALLVVRDVAHVALNVAEAALDALPKLPDSLLAEMSFSLDLYGLTGSAMVTLEGEVIASSGLAIGETIALSVELPVFGVVSVEL